MMTKIENTVELKKHGAPYGAPQRYGSSCVFTALLRVQHLMYTQVPFIS